MRVFVVVLLGLLLLATPAHAEKKFADLPAKAQKALAGAASEYLDPAQEFLWRYRKNFVTALNDLKEVEGIDALLDTGFLRQIVYQGRHFLPRFSDREWQRSHAVTELQQTGPYWNLQGESHRFSYTLPRLHPSERTLRRIPRSEPIPLLLCLHERRDTQDAEGRAERFPGMAALQRCYPKDVFGDLYRTWLMLAPVAARARFLKDGDIRHRYLTAVLTSFWRRYQVDFDRIVVDGGAPAAALVAAFPHVFAGIVLRPGAVVDFDVLQNWASVPVFVVDDDELVQDLERHGHPAVSTGDDEALQAWLGERRRQTTTQFRSRHKRTDHASAHWVVVTGPDWTAPVIEMTVETLDTESDPNTIRIDAVGVDHLNLFLNDEIVDLDRPVRLLVNGETRELGVIERDFGRLFEKDPEVRRNMNFGWLYTAVLVDVSVEGSGNLSEHPVPPRRPDAPARVLSLRERLMAQQAWLEGRPDQIEEHLGAADHAVTAVHLLPFALRDLWWRPAGGVGLRVRCEQVLQGLEGTLADQLRWILAGGGGDPYPRHADPDEDPWPVLTALVSERQMRETTGARWLPDESPVRRRKVLEAPEEWQDYYARWCVWFYDESMQTAYEGEDPQSVPEAFREADAEQDRLAAEVRTRNAWLAVLAGVLFVGGALVGGAFVAGRRASRA